MIRSLQYLSNVLPRHLAVRQLSPRLLLGVLYKDLSVDKAALLSTRLLSRALTPRTGTAGSTLTTGRKESMVEASHTKDAKKLRTSPC